MTNYRTPNACKVNILNELKFVGAYALEVCWHQFRKKLDNETAIFGIVLMLDTKDMARNKQPPEKIRGIRICR